MREVFDHLYLFSRVPAYIYGKTEEIFILKQNLYWKPTGSLICFVFAKTSAGSIVLMCSSLEQDPVEAIQLYCLRTRIGTMFEMLKQLLHVFSCRFWSKKMLKHSRKPKSNKTLQAPKPEDLKTVQSCWMAYERFVNLGAIALGLLQLISLKFSKEIWESFEGFLRTRSRELPSERTTKIVIAQLLVRDFLNVAPTATMREIRARIHKGKIEQKILNLERSQYQEAANM